LKATLPAVAVRAAPEPRFTVRTLPTAVLATLTSPVVALTEPLFVNAPVVTATPVAPDTVEATGTITSAPVPLAVRVTVPVVPVTVPVVRVEAAACGLIVTLVPVALTIPAKLPAPTTLIDCPAAGLKLIVPRVVLPFAAEILPVNATFSCPAPAFASVTVPPVVPLAPAFAVMLPLT